MQSEFVPVAKDFKGHVIGKGGYVLQDIRQISGADIRTKSKEEEGFTVRGNTEQIARARSLIEKKVVSCNFLDGILTVFPLTFEAEAVDCNHFLDRRI